MMRDAYGYLDIDDFDSVPTPGYITEVLTEQRLTRKPNARKVKRSNLNETED